MKYIDANRLIAYLEREADIEFKKTEENANSPVLCHFHNGCRMQALDTIDFIKQLQQEQPRVDLEKEIEIFTTQLYHETFGNDQGTLDEFDWEDIATVIEETARHFFELGLRRAAEMYDEIEYNRQRAEEESE